MRKLFLFIVILFCASLLRAQNITTLNLNGSGAACAVGNPWCLVVQLPSNTSSVGIVLSGTWMGTVQFEGTSDGVNYVSLSTASSTVNTTFTFVPIGLITVRCRISAYTSGAVTAAISTFIGTGNINGGAVNPITLNNIKFSNQFPGAPDLGLQINAASTAAGAGGTVWVTQSGTITTALSLAAQTHLIFEPGTYGIAGTQTFSVDGITIDCANPASTHLAPSATTDVFVITGAFFRMARCAIEPSSTSSRAGSAIFNIQGAQGELRDLRFLGNATSPTNGTAVLDTTANGAGGTWTFYGITHSQGTWTNGYNFKASSGTLAGITMDAIKSFVGLTYTSAFAIFDTLVDTVKVNKVQVGGTGPAIIVQNSGAGQAPRFVHMVDSSLECGGTGANVGLTITDGRDVSFQNGYIATCQNAVSISGGNQIDISHNLGITNIGQHCFLVTGGPADVTMDYNFVEDCGVTTTNTYDYFNIVGALQDFHIDFNHFRQLNANRGRWGINLLAGASNFFSVIGNDTGTAAFGTGFLSNNASGSNQFVHSNGAGIAGTFGTQTNLTGGIGVTNLLVSPTAPTISPASGFNTGTVTRNNGTASFVITVGSTGAVSVGTIGLPTAANGWFCQADNQTRGDDIQQTGNTTTSATFTNFGIAFGAVNWTNGDVINVQCTAN
jgi:hypothetical protein